MRRNPATVDLQPDLLPESIDMDLRVPGGHYYGEVVRRWEGAGFLLTETRYAPGVRLPRHSHANAYFCFVHRGAFTESFGSRTRFCGPQTLAFHPPGESHVQQFHQAPVRSFNLELTARSRQRLAELGATLLSPAEYQGGLVVSLVLRLHREFHLMDELSPLALEGLALEILAEASRQAGAATRKAPPWLGRVRELLHDRFPERLSLADLARAVGIHPAYLSSAFRKHEGCTLSDYVRQLRVQAASRRLATTDLSLAEIALGTGFADQAHFSRTFRRAMGLTPAAYRRLLRP
jgi:AraC family transcriptional regulator